MAKMFEKIAGKVKKNSSTDEKLNLPYKVF